MVEAVVFVDEMDGLEVDRTDVINDEKKMGSLERFQ